MRRHPGLMGMAAALAFTSEIFGPARRIPRTPKKKRLGPLNARLRKQHQLKGVRS